VPATFEGTCAGSILEQPRGEGGFGYDPYFFSDELGKTFGEATPEEKDRVSHRGRALRALVEVLPPRA
jgi:XTP/dITP diphosphohydrolase